MTTVYIVQHLHRYDEWNEDVKIIGVYASEAEAVAAVERMRSQPGFSDLPVIAAADDPGAEGFHLCPYVLGQDHWESGYVTA